jgi:oligosaccharide repeat unit polymerase
VSFYPDTALGLACGLLLATALRTRSTRRTYRSLGVIAALALITYLLGDGARSPVVISVVLAIMFADIIAGPIKLKTIAPAIALLLLAFMFAGYFRTYRDQGVVDAATLAVQDLRSSDEQRTSGEFISMLSKEAAIVDLYRQTAPEGVTYLFQSVLELVPSQLLPQKLDWDRTASTLSQAFLRSGADLGAGVAGTNIGDGYRFAGALGVAVLACIFGGILGIVQRWSMQVQAGAKSGPVLLRLALAASYNSLGVVIIRASLGEMLVYLLYGVVLPWLVLSSLIRRPSAWVPVLRGRSFSMAGSGKPLAQDSATRLTRARSDRSRRYE